MKGSVMSGFFFGISLVLFVRSHRLRLAAEKDFRSAAEAFYLANYLNQDTKRRRTLPPTGFDC